MIDSCRVRVTGALAPYRQSLWVGILDLGYAPLSARNLMHLAAHLSRWLDGQGKSLDSLTPALIEVFLEARRQAKYTHFLSLRALTPILRCLEKAGVVLPTPPAPELSSLEKLIQKYRGYLRGERGLTASRARAYADTARQFLRSCLGDELTLDSDLRLDASEVTSFVLESASRYSPGTVMNIVTALRSVLRYLYLEGYLAVDLTGAVPPIRHLRSSGLPKALEAGQVGRLLRTCDRRRHVGRRNYAVLVLLVRLGLRSCEVATLELDDIHWRSGEFRVRGKGNRHEHLPMPADVGEAVATYMHKSRPQTTDRHVFLGVRAPFAALQHSAIKAIANTALKRADLPTGSHRLRHTAATLMLRGGASLDEIAQVLRHQSHTTTAIYAKVDRGALISVARPWPGVAS